MSARSRCLSKSYNSSDQRRAFSSRGKLRLIPSPWVFLSLLDHKFRQAWAFSSSYCILLPSHLSQNHPPRPYTRQYGYPKVLTKQSQITELAKNNDDSSSSLPIPPLVDNAIEFATYTDSSNAALKVLTLLQPDASCDVDQMSATTLAYIGDVVFELLVRSKFSWPQRRTNDLQAKVVHVVRAETQSRLLHKTIDLFPMTEREKTIINRGRNAGSNSKGRNRGPKRLYSLNALDRGNNASTYQDSTALEAFIGYNFVKDMGRCWEILDFLTREIGVITDEI